MEKEVSDSTGMLCAAPLNLDQSSDKRSDTSFSDQIVKIRWVKNVLLARTNNFYEGNKIEWKDKFSMYTLNISVRFYLSKIGSEPIDFCSDNCAS